MPEPDIKKLLREGIAAAKAAQKKQTPSSPSPQKPIRKLASTPDSQKERARQLLLQVVELDETNITAWLWLSAVMDDLEDRFTCLNNVLILDPDNKAAQAGLAHLNKLMSTSPPDDVSAQTTSDQPHSSHSDCPFCYKPLPPSDTSCPHCQFPLVMNCPACNTRMDVEWEHCTHCHFEMGNYRLKSLYFTHLATAYQKHHRPAKAANALSLAEKMMPDQPDSNLYLQIGQVQAAIGQTRAAIATLEQALELEPDQVGPYLALGQVLHHQRHWQQAEETYRQAIKVIPKSSEIYFALGDLLLDKNDLKQARNYLQKSIKLDPQHGLAWARLGQVLELLQKRSVAIKSYQQAIDLLDPELFVAQQAQERLNILQPQLPDSMAQSWAEFMRQMAGPILICTLAALLDSGLRPWWIPWTGWLALFMALLGTFMWVSATSLPKNPFICLIINSSGLGESERPIMAFLGVLFWLLAMTIILMPINQSFPEPLL